jgi:hypothetical protein
MTPLCHLGARRGDRNKHACAAERRHAFLSPLSEAAYTRVPRHPGCSAWLRSIIGRSHPPADRNVRCGDRAPAAELADLSVDRIAGNT